MKKVLAIKGESAYNVLRKATDEICRGFENCGYEVDVIDATAKGAGERLLDSLARKQEYEFCFSLQALLWNAEKKTNSTTAGNQARGMDCRRPGIPFGKIAWGNGKKCKCINRQGFSCRTGAKGVSAIRTGGIIVSWRFFGK